MVRLPGVDSFKSLYERSSLIQFDNTHVRVASLEDLLAMKSVSDRPKDRLHEMELRAIKQLREEI